MLCTFSFGCFQIYQNKCVKIIAILIRTIVPIKYMPKISAVGLFCLYKFFRMSKLNEPYFKRFFMVSFNFMTHFAYINYKFTQRISLWNPTNNLKFILKVLPIITIRKHVVARLIDIRNLEKFKGFSISFYKV